MKYFLDTNIIIDLLKEKEEAIEILSNIASDPDSVIYINRLVELETLRGIRFAHSRRFQIAQRELEKFEKLDITQDIYSETTNFARYCKSKGITLKKSCEAIDYLHFITAKYYGLQIISIDRDMSALEDKYQEFTQM